MPLKTGGFRRLIIEMHQITRDLSFGFFFMQLLSIF